MLRSRVWRRLGFRLYTNHAHTISNDGSDYSHISTLIGVSSPHLWFPAAREIKRKIICHVGPTNSGKTHKAVKSLMAARCGLYCAPLRLLSWEISDRLNKSGVPCHLITGQEQDVVKGGNHISCTVEVADLLQMFQCTVIDEMQMIADHSRGWAWTRAFLGVCTEELHICGSESFLPVVEELCGYTNETMEVHRYERLGKLTVGKEFRSYNDVKPGDALVSFSRRNVLHTKTAVDSYRKDKTKSTAVIYGALPPETRREQARLFNVEDSALDVLAATDAIGMGLNLQISKLLQLTSYAKLERIVFQSLKKFDGLSVRALTGHEIRQIAGRAGRFGTRYVDGEVTTLGSIKGGMKLITDAISEKDSPLTSAGIKPTLEQVERFQVEIRIWLMTQYCMLGGAVADLPDGYPVDIQSRVSSLLGATLSKVKSQELLQGDTSMLLSTMNTFFNDSKEKTRVRPMTQQEREDVESNYLAALWHKQANTTENSRSNRLSFLKEEMIRLMSLPNLVQLFNKECGLRSYFEKRKKYRSSDDRYELEHNLYFACDSSDFIALARILEGISMSFQDSFVFCSSPISISGKPLLVAWFRRYAQKFAASEEIKLEVSCDHISPVDTAEELRELETMNHLLDIYIWLSFKYPDIFVDGEKASAQRVLMSDLIEASLLALKRPSTLNDMLAFKNEHFGKNEKDVEIPTNAFDGDDNKLIYDLGLDAKRTQNASSEDLKNMQASGTLSKSFRGQLLKSNLFSVFKK